MTGNIIFGLNINFAVLFFMIGLFMIVIGIIEVTLFDASCDEFGFWLGNIVCTALIVGFIALFVSMYNEDKYAYVGLSEDKEIHNVVPKGKNASGFYIIGYTNSDGSVEEATIGKVLCINGKSRLITCGLRVDSWLYSDVKREQVMALNYNDYNKTVGNTDELFQNKYIVSLIKDANLSVLGFGNTEIEDKIYEEEASGKEVDSISGADGNKVVSENTKASENQVISENKTVSENRASDLENDLLAIIDQKDKLIGDYEARNLKLEEEVEAKKAIIEEHEKTINKLEKSNEKLKNKKEINFKSTDFINVCIGIGILVLVGMGVFLMIAYTKHKLAKIEMTLKSELKIREGVMLDKDLK